MTITVTVRDANGAPVPGAIVESTWHYKTTTEYEDGMTNSNGIASLSRGISSASAGYTVEVDVDATKDRLIGSGSTSFMPVTY